MSGDKFQKLAHWSRNQFFAGLFISLPVVATLWVLNLLYEIINSRFDPLVVAVVDALITDFPQLHWITVVTVREGEAIRSIPCAGFLLTVLFLILIGTLASNWVGKKVVGMMDQMILKVPVASTVYNATKQVIESVQLMGKSGSMQFSKVVLVPYPGMSAKLLGFVTSQFKDVYGRSLFSVYLPTSPSPLTGFVLVIPEDELEISMLSVEDATKAVISCGLVVPKNIVFPPVSFPASAEENKKTVAR